MIRWEMIALGHNKWSYVIHEHDGHRTAEVTGEGIVIHSAGDILDIVGSVIWNNEADALAIHEENITPEFFDLTTGVLGEIVQKCSNYQFRLAVIGNFAAYPSASLQAFIRESNRGRHVFFAGSLPEALTVLRGAD